MHQLTQTIISHAQKMRVVANNVHIKCVDGGYREHEAVGALAMPGGALGLSMTVLGAGLTPQEAYEYVYTFLQEKGIRYGWHTDTHEGHGSIVGCGHCNAAISQGERYGLDGTQVQELLDIIRTEQANAGDMECVVLDREHAEQAILVITSSNYTVKPWDESDNRQVFIYDQTRHHSLLVELADYLSRQNIVVSSEKLQEIAGTHTNATLGLLASSKGKPMFSADVSTEEPVVEYVGDAPVL